MTSRAITTSTAADPVTYEAFLGRPEESSRGEWVDGRIIALAPISHEHQSAGSFLLKLLDEYVTIQKLGRVLYEPFQMKLPGNLPGRSPDIMFLSKRHLKRLKRTYVDGPADLTVEIVSPESRTRDRGDKFREYEQGGVSEYWIVDPARKRAEFYVNRAGAFEVAPTKDGIYRSRVVDGLWLKTQWIWDEPHPSLSVVLREWGIA